MTKALFFGSYDPDYPRNKLTRKAMEQLGFQVVDCNDRSSGVLHFTRLVRDFVQKGPDCSLVFVPILGHYDLPLIWILTRFFRKKIIFDAFYSLYETYVIDRDQVKPRSISAIRFFIYDWLSTHLADKVIFDTKEHISYFYKTYGVRMNKMFELPVSADSDIFKYSPPKKHKVFTVGFYGSFLPLHGVEIIVESFKYVREKDIKCILWGEGPGVQKIKKLIKKHSLNKKIRLTEQKVSYNQLPRYFNKVDLFLGGPFGNSDKAKKVVPAKIAEALCSGVPTIVARTPATSRILNDYEGIIWLDLISAINLAEKIEFCKKLHLKKNNNIRRKFLKSPLRFEILEVKLSKILD